MSRHIWQNIWGLQCRKKYRSTHTFNHTHSNTYTQTLSLPLSHIYTHSLSLFPTFTHTLHTRLHKLLSLSFFQICTQTHSTHTRTHFSSKSPQGLFLRIKPQKQTLVQRWLFFHWRLLETRFFFFWLKLVFAGRTFSSQLTFKKSLRNHLKNVPSCF